MKRKYEKPDMTTMKVPSAWGIKPLGSCISGFSAGEIYGTCTGGGNPSASGTCGPGTTPNPDNFCIAGSSVA